MRRPPLEQREWLTSTEVAAHFGRSRQAVDKAADAGRLPHDLVMHGTRKERRFPKVDIQAIERWPGYATTLLPGSADDALVAESARLRAENATLREEVTRARTDSATGEMKIDELHRAVRRQQRALRALVDALVDEEVDVERLLATLVQLGDV